MADRPPASIPQRTCVGCRTRAAQSDLVRVVAWTGSEDADGVRAVLDPARVHPGRGAYLHPTRACLELAERRRALTRALRVPGIATDELWDQLEQYLVSLATGTE